jgi:RimJ/RimL family protein N-acetyltransferase
MRVPPEVLVGPTLLLRRQVVADAEDLTAVVVANAEHLRPWMGWLDKGGTSVESQRTRIAGQAWEPGHEWGYLMRDPADDRIIGGCSLMPRRGPGTLEIGYWVHVAHTGRGAATEAAGLLTTAACAIDGVEVVWIVCDEANVRSSAVPRRLGYRLDRVDAEPIDAPAATGRTQWWRHDVAATG